MNAALRLVPDTLQAWALKSIMAALRADNRAVVGDSGRHSFAHTLGGSELFGGLVGETYMAGSAPMDSRWRRSIPSAAMRQPCETRRGQGAPPRCHRLRARHVLRKAPGSDRKLGYRKFGQFDGFSVGHRRHHPIKAL